MTEQEKYDFFKSGQLLLIDKPYKWTSFDVVNYIRKIVSPPKNRIKVGHAGTLDPLATGLLLLCTGSFTKRIDEFTTMAKTYRGQITIGKTTPSFDLETEVSEVFPIQHITDDAIYELAKSFIGVTLQTPPLYSAKKIDGERAYIYARSGVEKELKEISIDLSEFTVDKIERTNDTILVDFTIACSKGTYIRSIAYDFGKKLNSGGFLSRLVRTKIDTHLLENAYSLEQFRELYSNKNVEKQA